MRLIDPSFEILQPFDCVDPVEATKKAIERAGRLSYKSEDKITERSWIQFYDMLKSKRHLSVFEHGTLYLVIPIGLPTKDKGFGFKLALSKFFKENYYSRCIYIPGEDTNPELRGTYYITTNLRVIEEAPNLELQKVCNFISNKTEFHIPRISVKFICSRAIANELVRHRAFSFIQESQRYVNYSNDKFGGEVVFINPEYNGPKGCFKFEETLRQCEKAYFYLQGLSWKPQEAREVLPNATKTEIIMTGYPEDWEYFFILRTAINAHPEMRRLTIPLQEEFRRLGYVQ